MAHDMAGGVKVKTADTTRSATATLADDDHLVGWKLSAAGIYAVTGYFLATADAASRDLKFTITNTETDSSLTALVVDATTAGTVDNGIHSDLSSESTVDIDGTADVAITIDGHMTHSVNGTVSLQWAQNTAAGTTTLKKGSWLRFDYLGENA
jgi:hypothetical protein